MQKENLQFVSQMDDTIDKICTKPIVTLSICANHGLTSALTWKWQKGNVGSCITIFVRTDLFVTLSS